MSCVAILSRRVLIQKPIMATARNTATRAFVSKTSSSQQQQNHNWNITFASLAAAATLGVGSAATIAFCENSQAETKKEGTYIQATSPEQLLNPGARLQQSNSNTTAAVPPFMVERNVVNLIQLTPAAAHLSHQAGNQTETSTNNNNHPQQNQWQNQHQASITTAPNTARNDQSVPSNSNTAVDRQQQVPSPANGSILPSDTSDADSFIDWNGISLPCGDVDEGPPSFFYADERNCQENSRHVVNINGGKGYETEGRIVYKGMVIDAAGRIKARIVEGANQQRGEEAELIFDKMKKDDRSFYWAVPTDKDKNIIDENFKRLVDCYKKQKETEKEADYSQDQDQSIYRTDDNKISYTKMMILHTDKKEIIKRIRQAFSDQLSHLRKKEEEAKKADPINT